MELTGSLVSIAGAYVDKIDPSLLACGADLRRASRGMLLCESAIQGVMSSCRSIWDGIEPARRAIVVGTSHGELSTTKEFLSSIGQTGVARPILFQNSLHNSPLGFLTHRYGIEGAGITVSNGIYSSEDALQTASDLVSQENFDIAMIVAFDVVVDGLEQIRSRCYPPGLIRGEGAACLIVVRPEFFKKTNGNLLQKLAKNSYVLHVAYNQTNRFDEDSSEVYTSSAAFYDSDGLACILKSIPSQSPGTFVLRKIDQKLIRCSVNDVSSALKEK